MPTIDLNEEQRRKGLITWAGVAGDGSGDDEDAGADGRADPEEHELEDAELPHEALAGGGGRGARGDGLAAERGGAEAGEEGAAGRGGGRGPVVRVFSLHGVCGGGVERLASSTGPSRSRPRQDREE